MLRLASQPADLLAQRLILGGLALQETHSVSRFLAHSLRRQHVQVRALLLAVAEIVRLYQAAIDQSLQAIVDLADADAEFFGEPSLGNLRVAFQLAQDLKMLVVRSCPLMFNS